MADFLADQKILADSDQLAKTNKKAWRHCLSILSLWKRVINFLLKWVGLQPLQPHQRHQYVRHWLFYVIFRDNKICDAPSQHEGNFRYFLPLHSINMLILNEKIHLTWERGNTANSASRSTVRKCPLTGGCIILRYVPLTETIAEIWEEQIQFKRKCAIILLT